MADFLALVRVRARVWRATASQYKNVDRGMLGDRLDDEPDSIEGGETCELFVSAISCACDGCYSMSLRHMDRADVRVLLSYL